MSFPWAYPSRVQVSMWDRRVGNDLQKSLQCLQPQLSIQLKPHPFIADMYLKTDAVCIISWSNPSEILPFRLQCSSFSPSCTLRAQNSPAIHWNDLGFCAHFPPASQVPCSFKSQIPIFPCIAIASVAGPTTYSVGVMLENIATCLMLFTLSSGV